MKITTTFLFLFLGVVSLAQQTHDASSRIAPQISPVSNVERYGVDYALKNYVFQDGDSTVLEQINLDALEHHRNPSQDIEVLDQTTGLIVILYHRKRAKKAKETNQNVNQ